MNKYFIIIIIILKNEELNWNKKYQYMSSYNIPLNHPSMFLEIQLLKDTIDECCLED